MSWQPDYVIDVVCGFYNADRKEVTGSHRDSRYVRTREAIIVMLRDEKNMSYSSIGRKLNKHHTTVITAYKRAKKKIVSDNSFSHELCFIKEMFNSPPVEMGYVQ